MIITSLVQKLADNKKHLQLKFEKISKDEYKDASLCLGAIQAPKIKAENRKFQKEAEVIFKRFRAIDSKKAETTLAEAQKAALEQVATFKKSLEL